MSHKAGFINIIGYPNSGKSTLLNEILGERISIVTDKAQTTRHRILGMLNTEEYQMVFSDTPGILDPKYKLQESMMKEVILTFRDADHVLVLIDLSNPKEFEAGLLQRIQTSKVPVTILLNKLDIAQEVEVMKQHDLWSKLVPKATVRIVSALHKHGTKELIDLILETLPESPPYFPKDQLTDKSERFIVSEIVRKQVYLLTSQEIPYSSEVAILSFKEEDDIIRIEANIIVTRDSQKAIIIGEGGKMIKKIGTAARQELEVFFQKKIFIETFVKVDKDWRTKDAKLKKYGYH